MKVREVVDQFYKGNTAKNGNLKSERRGDILYLVHYDTDIAKMENGNISINSVNYTRTTSQFTHHLRNLCQDDFTEFEGTPSDRVHYYDMGEKR